MADLPILFSAPMVCGLLGKNGARKIQTRRLPGRLRKFGSISQFGPSDTAGYDWHFRDKSMRWHDLRHDEMLAALPWKTGDRLWVKETWQAGMTDGGPAVAYRANLDRWYPDFEGEDEGAGPSFDYDAHPTTSWDAGHWIADVEARGPWASPLHMPRWASRLTLPVIEVRIERLQDICEDDAIDEGVEPLHGGWFPYGITTFMTTFKDGREVPAQYCTSARDSYHMLWNHIHGPGAWDENPWVVAITFDVIPRPSEG